MSVETKIYTANDFVEQDLVINPSLSESNLLRLGATAITGEEAQPQTSQIQAIGESPTGHEGAVQQITA